MLRNLKIGARLGLAFGLLLFLMAGAAGARLWRRLEHAISPGSGANRNQVLTAP